MLPVKEKAIELLKTGKVSRVLGWKTGEFVYDLTPAFFHSAEEAEHGFVYNTFSAANLSKYLIAESRKEGVVGVFLKPCDSYSFQQLMKEHRVDREKVYIVGIACNGVCSADVLREKGIQGIIAVSEHKDSMTLTTLYGEKTISKREGYLERCVHCKSHKVVVFDEMLGQNGEENPNCGRFDEVRRLEALSPEDRFDFWKKELSRCIRCNACRNVCPACSCEKCVFDNDRSGIAQKAAASSFEEQNFHIIRAYHVASRCTDCGECSRVCPQSIPLHLLNRKFILDINDLYGTYQAGADLTSKPPLMDFRKDDCEPSIVSRRGGNL